MTYFTGIHEVLTGRYDMYGDIYCSVFIFQRSKRDDFLKIQAFSIPLIPDLDYLLSDSWRNPTVKQCFDSLPFPKNVYSFITIFYSAYFLLLLKLSIKTGCRLKSHLTTISNWPVFLSTYVRNLKPLRVREILPKPDRLPSRDIINILLTSSLRSVLSLTDPHF